MPIFDTARDNALIAAGTHFLCHTCFVARPLSEQSQDDTKCQGCYDFLQSEKEQTVQMPKDYWDSNLTFVHYGQRYGIPTLEPEPIKQPENTGPDISQNTPQKPSDKKRPCNTPEGGELYQPLDFVTKMILELSRENKSTREIAEILKSQGNQISHMTVARRLQGQGVLI